MSMSIAIAKKAFCACVFSILLSGCNFSTTQPKDPQFTKDKATISGELRNMVTCGPINMYGYTIITNGKAVNTQLSIEFINPTNADDNQNELGKKIATQLRQDLKDTNEYSSYKITFIKKTSFTTITRSYIYTKDKL